MKHFNQKSSLAFYSLHAGFKAFKKRLKEELSVCKGIDMEEYINDDDLYPFYRQKESVSYAIACLFHTSIDY